jgi:hypothetical protein
LEVFMSEPQEGPDEYDDTPTFSAEDTTMDTTYPLHSYNHHTYQQPHNDCRGIEDLVLSNQIGGGFRDTLSAIHTNSVNVMQAVEHNGLAGIQETAQQGSANLAATERNGGETRSSVERNGGETRASVERNHGETRAIIDRFANATCHDFADVRREAVEHKYQLTLQAAEHHAKSALQASENACAIRAQLAECCCEIKELVRAENGATREMIAGNEQGRLRDALADSKQAMLLMQINDKQGK